MTSNGEGAESNVLQALARGDRQALAEALQSGGDANAKDRWGTPALSLAVGRGDLEAVGRLLEHGGDPNLTGAVGNTPLMVAAARGQPDIARTLLKSGAKSDAANDWGLSAVDWAQWASDSAEMHTLLVDFRGKP